jgi:hypothetical protein
VFRHRIFWLFVATAVSSIAHAQSPGLGSYSFAVVGDMPYFRYEREAVTEIIKETNGHDLAFVLHVGDFKSGFDHCTDEFMHWTKRLFDSSRHALIYTPGDNDWTDCHRPSNGGYEPEERLNRLRQIFYADESSHGQNRLRLERQSANPRFSDYRENVRWQRGPVLFVTLHIVGSGNNFGRTPAGDAEHRRRNAANIAWLTESFELASRRLMRAIVITIHANPLFEVPETERARRGFNDFLRRLRAETIAFGKPVLLVHGDTHRYRVDKPMIDPKAHRPVENFTRVETFGTPFLGWVKVTVDTDRAELFVIEPHRYQPQTREGTP